jgi:AcrR family transcriptional regulator
MLEVSCEAVDPPIRRTRQLLQQALEKLLETKEFEKISVQDIADAATVNRATFYDHYTDKFALLECLVGARFLELLAQRQVNFDGSCPGALRAIVLAVCDYLGGMPAMKCKRQPQLEPHLESAVIEVVRRILLPGLRQHASEGAMSPELVSAAASWAIYGAVKEWVRMPDRCPSDQIVDTVTALVTPIFGAAYGTKGQVAVEPAVKG